MKVYLIKIIKLGERVGPNPRYYTSCNYFIKEGFYMLIPKSSLKDEPEYYNFKYEILLEFDVPEGMYAQYNRYHYGQLRDLVNLMKSAIQMARTAHSRIPIRQKMIKEIDKLIILEKEKEN